MDSRQPATPERGSTGLGGGPGLHFEAAIFDMDGVVANSAVIHSKSWKRVFDEYLQFRSAHYQEPFVEFTHDHDYLGYLDGRPRYDGIEAFLQSRGISIPRGNPDDWMGAETVCAIGGRKNAIFNQIIETEGVDVFESTVSLIRDLLARGVKVGLATSSYNSAVVLGKTGTRHLFGTVVDGLESAILGLRGKPEPDIFVTAASNLGVTSSRAIVFEDAVTGVRAGAKGGFALVIGIAREDNAKELSNNGADVVVEDLSETNLEEIDRLVQAKRASAR
ncbi:MAG TPA: HAD-IA family hydrolase [Opitutaceae bacterium]|jgi:HAD superfamily hydrolase (TIGR01509 family)|nr:HAD-IA family hydrolase [Opitutaceae bacterium]